ncbi:MAG: hypothetical protein AB7P69_03720 [Candidatus Binatia bacterium]
MADVSLMTDLERTVWEWLVAHHPGAAQDCPRADILARYNIYHVKKLSDREFRATCADLVAKFNLAICTTSGGGYYVARTPQELEHAVRDLESRAVAILERAKALKQARPLEPQGRLFS